jgi:hypothetical protein
MLEMVQQSHDMLGELQKQVFTMNIRGASLKADMTETVLETTRTAKALMGGRRNADRCQEGGQAAQRLAHLEQGVMRAIIGMLSPAPPNLLRGNPNVSQPP